MGKEIKPDLSHSDGCGWTRLAKGSAFEAAFYGDLIINRHGFYMPFIPVTAQQLSFFGRQVIVKELSGAGVCLCKVVGTSKIIACNCEDILLEEHGSDWAEVWRVTGWVPPGVELS